MGEILDDGNDGKPEFLTPALPRSFAVSHELQGTDTALKLEKTRSETPYDTYTGRPYLVILPITVKLNIFISKYY